MSDKININRCNYDTNDAYACSRTVPRRFKNYGDDNTWANLSKYCRKNMQQSIISCIPKACSGDKRYVGCTDTCKVDRSGFNACVNVCDAKYTRDNGSRKSCISDCNVKKNIIEKGQCYQLPKLCSIDNFIRPNVCKKKN